jgi:hypothetical protein
MVPYTSIAPTRRVKKGIKIIVIFAEEKWRGL